MATKHDPTRGVTAPMSEEAPTPQDMKLDDTLMQELKARNEFESQEETARRYVNWTSSDLHTCDTDTHVV